MYVQCFQHPALTVRHGFFGSLGGVSPPPFASLDVGTHGRINPDHARENKRRALAFLFRGKEPFPLYMPKQEHTTQVIVVEDTVSSDINIPADALVTVCPNVVLGISTADCGPVLFHDPVHAVIGVAHAGWRGALGGILENTIKVMQDLGAKRESIIAVLGPSIRKNHYEVSADLYDIFCIETRKNMDFFHPLGFGKYMFDLPSYILCRLSLVLCAVYDTGLDTFMEPFFSCRRALSLGEKHFGTGLSAICLDTME